MRRQEPQEPVDTFITSLYCLAEYCEFGTLKEQLIRDRIIVGLADSKVSEKLQLDSSLTLQKAIDVTRQSESIKKQQGILRNQRQPVSSDASVDAIKRSQRRNQKPKATQESSSTKCPRCGNQNHNRNVCPAKDVNCRKFKKKGHFAKVCRSEKLSEIREEIESSDEEYFFGEISQQQQQNTAWRAKVKVNDVLIDFKMDSGADVIVIGDHVYGKLLSKVPLRKTNKRLYGPCRNRMACLGPIDVVLMFTDKSTKDSLYVIENLETPLLSRAASTQLGGIARVPGVSDSAKKIREIPQAFTGIGCMDGEYEIKL